MVGGRRRSAIITAAIVSAAMVSLFTARENDSSRQMGYATTKKTETKRGDKAKKREEKKILKEEKNHVGGWIKRNQSNLLPHTKAEMRLFPNYSNFISVVNGSRTHSLIQTTFGPDQMCTLIPAVRLTTAFICRGALELSEKSIRLDELANPIIAAGVVPRKSRMRDGRCARAS